MNSNEKLLAWAIPAAGVGIVALLIYNQHKKFRTQHPVNELEDIVTRRPDLSPVPSITSVWDNMSQDMLSAYGS